MTDDKMATLPAKRGKGVLTELAKTYPQLYLTPGEAGAEQYKRIVRLGEDAPVHSLSHFHGHDADSLTIETTPAGSVQVITLNDRGDFELFLHIMAYRCVPTAIPPTQGASILDGVINWRRIRAHHDAFMKTNVSPAQWPAEFKRFTADKSNYTDALIVLSVGPYSAIPAERVGRTESQWLIDSGIIRRFHECTHFICRRLFPSQKDAVWDELVADAVGLYAAYGRYDRKKAELFLGIDGNRYVGGRLENYVTDGADKTERLNALASRVHRALERIEKTTAEAGAIDPFELAVRLESQQKFW